MFSMPIYSALPFFILSFVLIYVAVKRSALFNNYMSALSVFLQKKTFPSYSEHEVIKFSILRIVLSRVYYGHTLIFRRGGDCCCRLFQAKNIEHIVVFIW
jgi:hypothetical protein